MKYSIFLISFIFLLFAFADSTIIQNNLHKMQLKGKVQKIRTFISNIDSANPYNEKTTTYFVEKHLVFNEAGFLIENYTYNEETNTAEFKEVITYDEKNRKIKSEKRNLLVDNNDREIVSYTYNEIGLLTTSISESRMGKSGTKYLYDEKNNLVKTVGSSPFGSFEMEWKYNEMGLVVEEIMPNSYVMRTYYDSLNQISSKIVEYSDGFIDKVQYKYNDKGDDIENHIFTIQDKITEEFLVSIEYIYDSQQNWVQKTKILNGKIIEITKRSISYF